MNQINTRFLIALFFLVYSSWYPFLPAGVAPLWGQESQEIDFDIVAPSIRYDLPLEQAFSERELTIRATVTDNQAVSDVHLFYRRSGTNAYSRIPMQSQEQNIYSATLFKEAVTLPALEYYIQATDSSGNISFKGFSTSPLTVLLVKPPPPEAVPEQPKQEQEEVQIQKALPPLYSTVTSNLQLDKPWYKKGWVWTIVGAVVVGAAASGGGGGGAGTGDGTIVITGPAP